MHFKIIFGKITGREMHSAGVALGVGEVEAVIVVQVRPLGSSFAQAAHPERKDERLNESVVRLSR